MPDTRDTPDRSDIRALARVILEQEEREQAAMRPRHPSFELHPVRRRVTRGLRVGLLVGLALGLASSGLGTMQRFDPTGWLESFVFFTVVAPMVGAVVGAVIGVAVRWSQRYELAAELDLELEELARSTTE